MTSVRKERIRDLGVSRRRHKDETAEVYLFAVTVVTRIVGV